MAPKWRLEETRVDRIGGLQDIAKFSFKSFGALNVPGTQQLYFFTKFFYRLFVYILTTIKNDS